MLYLKRLGSKLNVRVWVGDSLYRPASLKRPNMYFASHVGKFIRMCDLCGTCIHFVLLHTYMCLLRQSEKQ